MSLAMATVVLGLSLLVVDICYGLNPARLTCDQLPKLEVPSIEVVIAQAPFRYDYTLTSVWECTTIEYSRPPRGITSHHGTILNMQGTVLNRMEYTIDSDKKTIHTTHCSNGKKLVWYLSAAHFDENGGFYCVYTCNNITLQEFLCFSNNNTTSPAEAAELARLVPNGHLIHNAWENCPGSQECTVF